MFISDNIIKNYLQSCIMNYHHNTFSVRARSKRAISRALGFFLCYVLLLNLLLDLSAREENLQGRGF